MTTYLSDYQTFNSKQELNYNVSLHEKAHQAELTSTSRTVLRFIARYSVKYAGASHLKVETIAEGVSKSVRTIARQLKRLEDLCIIGRRSMIRPKSGGKGASIIIILPFAELSMADRTADSAEGEKPSEPKDEPAESENEPLRKLKKRYTLKDTGAAEAEASAAQNYLPNVLYRSLAPFFTGETLHKLVGVVFRAKGADVRLEAHEGEFRSCISDCVRRYRKGAIRSLNSYLYASVKALSRRLFMTDMHAELYGA